jgi:hypothetical protein
MNKNSIYADEEAQLLFQLGTIRALDIKSKRVSKMFNK